MANQVIDPQPGDVADEHGRFATVGLPGEPEMEPIAETGGDATPHPGPSDQGASGPPVETRTPGGDPADPGAGAKVNPLRRS